MLAFFVALDNIITYLICDEKSLLLANKASVNASSYKVLTSSLTNFSPLPRFLICQSRRLFKAFASSSARLIT
jgi:hypothetical protein